MATMMRVGFVGPGLMGHGAAKHILLNRHSHMLDPGTLGVRYALLPAAINACGRVIALFAM